MDIDSNELRQLLGHFATGVAVVTATEEAGEQAGVTINSFASVSLSPELILFGLTRTLWSLPIFERVEHYAISFLTSDQQAIAKRFASRGSDKWSDTPASVGRYGSLLIDGALAHLECTREAVFDGGDHRIFLCRVLAFEKGEATEPLVFYRGRYHEIIPSGSRHARMESRLPAR